MPLWRLHTDGMRCLLGAVMEEEWREIEKVVGRASWTGAQGKPPRRGCVSRGLAMGGMEGGGCMSCTKLQGCRGLDQGNEELLRLSTGAWWEVGAAARSYGAYWAPAWSLDFTQSINSGSGELWLAFLKDHFSCCVWNNEYPCAWGTAGSLYSKLNSNLCPLGICYQNLTVTIFKFLAIAGIYWARTC